MVVPIKRDNLEFDCYMDASSSHKRFKCECVGPSWCICSAYQNRAISHCDRNKTLPGGPCRHKNKQNDTRYVWLSQQSVCQIGTVSCSCWVYGTYMWYVCMHIFPYSIHIFNRFRQNPPMIFLIYLTSSLKDGLFSLFLGLGTNRAFIPPWWYSCWEKCVIQEVNWNCAKWNSS